MKLTPVQLSSCGLLCQTSATLMVRITGSYRLVGSKRSLGHGHMETEGEIV